jgi:hypothetical protein
MLLVIVMALFAGPVLVFAPKLRAARLAGQATFRSFAARYVQEFEDKWLVGTPPATPVLGTPDLQSLADLANSAQTVRDMRTIPLSRRIVTTYAMGIALPFLPLLLLKFPIAELAAMLFKRLTGL